ncbi:response regulator transcription factor [Andreprevotia chitinilytica]|uniref:response regulator transcription factor n=1 Tax=Andreprevotia chitinilytica TaxID=396808 RepID=UPI000692110E|nr:response regulator transcription factor [Andreprevotia chitinilytica]
MRSQPPLNVVFAGNNAQSWAGLAHCFKANGFGFHTLRQWHALYPTCAALSADLVLLDIANSGMSVGADQLADLQPGLTSSHIPTIVLADRSDPMERVAALEMGACDYVTQPCEPRELVARTRSILRRIWEMPPAKESCAAQMQFGDWSLDLMDRHLVCDGFAPIALSRKQLDIMRILFTYPDSILDRDQILHMLRDHPEDYSVRAIDQHISRIRKKITGDTLPDLIKTVRSTGYMLIAH